MKKKRNPGHEEEVPWGGKWQTGAIGLLKKSGGWKINSFVTEIGSQLKPKPKKPSGQRSDKENKGNIRDTSSKPIKALKKLKFPERKRHS